MSHKATMWAWAQERATGLGKLVLLALADCHNGKTGLCNPSNRLLSQKTGLAGRTIRVVLADLQGAGLIGRMMVSGSVCEFTLAMPEAVPARAQKDALTPAPHAAPPGTTCRPPRHHMPPPPACGATAYKEGTRKEPGIEPGIYARGAPVPPSEQPEIPSLPPRELSPLDRYWREAPPLLATIQGVKGDRAAHMWAGKALKALGKRPGRAMAVIRAAAAKAEAGIPYLQGCLQAEVARLAADAAPPAAAPVPEAVDGVRVEPVLDRCWDILGGDSRFPKLGHTVAGWLGAGLPPAVIYASLTSAAAKGVSGFAGEASLDRWVRACVRQAEDA